MSASSNEDIEKDAGFARDGGAPHLTEEQEDLREASEPPFTTEPAPHGEANGNNLEKIATTASSKPSVNNIKLVPNGGLTAWLQVLASFFLFFNSWVNMPPTDRTCRSS